MSEDTKQSARPRTILITRPEEDARSFASALEALGYRVLSAPMLRVDPLPFAMPRLDDYQALVFTSANAVRVFCAQTVRRDLPVYAVGSHTAEAARGEGFMNVRSAEKDSAALVQMIGKHARGSALPLLHVRGQHVAQPVSQMLRERGISAEELIVYSTAAAAELPSDILYALRSGEIEAILFFSRRTAQSFLKLAERYRLAPELAVTKALCIGAGVLECVQSQTWLETYTSRSPDRAGMMTLLRRVCPPAGEKDIQGGIMSNNAHSIQNEQPLEEAGEIIERFGGIRPMAKKMGVAVTTVQGWKKRDVIPANRIEQVLESAANHNIDLSGLVDGAPARQPQSAPARQDIPVAVEPEEAQMPATETATSGIANENVQGTGTYMPRAESIRPAQKPAEHFTRPQASSFAAPKSERSGSDLDAKLSITERNAIKKSTWINFFLLAAGLCGLAFILFGGEQGDMHLTQKVSTLEEDVGEIRQDVDSVKEEQSFMKTMIPENLDERIGRLQAQADAAIAKAEAISADVMADDGSTPLQRAQKLNGHVYEMTGVDVASHLGLDALAEKLTALASTAAGQSQLDQTIAELGAVLSSFERQATDAALPQISLEEQINLARANMPALQSTFAEVPAEDLKAAAVLLGFSQFRQSLNRDRAAFNDDLAVLQMLVGDNNPELSEAINRLAPYSERGVLTPDGLTREFKTIAGEAVIESIKGENVSLEDKVKGRLGAVFQVEKNGEPLIGNDTQITMYQAQDYLDQGDLASAVALVEQLDGPAAQVTAPWLREAKATLSARRLQNILAQVMSSGGLASFGLGGGHMIRDEMGSTNIYVPQSTIEGTIKKSVEDVLNKSGM